VPPGSVYWWIRVPGKCRTAPGTGIAELAEIVAFPPRPNEGTRQYNTSLIYYIHGFMLDRLASTDPHAYPETSRKDSIIYTGV
jgi:hypothetical protein